MSTPISVNGRTVVVDKRTISIPDLEALTLIRGLKSVTYRFLKTGANGSLAEGDVLAVASDLEVIITITDPAGAS